MSKRPSLFEENLFALQSKMKEIESQNGHINVAKLVSFILTIPDKVRSCMAYKYHEESNIYHDILLSL